jgi:DNA polymerase
MDNQAKLDTIAKRWKGCKRCELHKGRHNVVFWRGNLRGKLLGVIGEAPGEAEDLRGEPFLGDAGKLFDELCEKAGGPEPWDMFVCNMVGCRPPRNRPPTREEWAACKGRLYSMLAVVRPKALLLLGSTALSCLTPKTKVTECRGQQVQVSIPWKSGELVFPAIPTLHPGFLLRTRDRKIEKAMVHDIREAWALAQGGGWVEGD